MDVVETITFTRRGIDKNSKDVFVSGVYVPAEEKARSEWSQEEIDAIGEAMIGELDAEIERLKEFPIAESIQI